MSHLIALVSPLVMEVRNVCDTDLRTGQRE